jgi:hypothetical protein
VIPVVWLSYDEKTISRGFWDQAMLEALFSHELWRPVGAHDFKHLDSLDGLDGAVIVLPARSQVDYVDQLNVDIARLEWLVLILTGDEEAIFPFEKLNHNNAKLWVMSPRKNREYPEGTRFIGTGFPPQARPLLAKYKQQALDRELDYFFAGQVTHERRIALVTAVKAWNSRIRRSRGRFTPQQPNRLSSRNVDDRTNHPGRPRKVDRATPISSSDSFVSTALMSVVEPQ